MKKGCYCQYMILESARVSSLLINQWRKDDNAYIWFKRVRVSVAYW